MSKRLIVIVVALFMTLFSSDVGAQRVADRIDVTVVEVPVTVSDRTGQSIRGLTAANFELIVDGKKTPIEYFETVDLTTVTAREGQPAPRAAYRNFLLLFDLANSSPGTIGRAQQAARTFVTSQLREHDLAAVATFTTEQGARMLTSFTRDRELLDEAIRTLGHPEYYKVADPLFLVTQSTVAGRSEKKEEDQEALADYWQQLDTLSARRHDDEMRRRIRTQLKNLGSVARALDRLYGQKQVILLSEGFDARLLTGRTDLSSQAARAENEAVITGEVWKVDSDARFGSASEATDVREMAELFRRSDVRMHAIDIRGLRSEVDAREGARKSSNEGLHLVTNPTGGTVLRNTNDLGSQLEGLLSRQEVIYLLGFKPKSGSKPGQFHSVNVKLVGARGDVTHRSGYYDQTAQMSGLETTLALGQLLASAVEISDVPTTVTVAAAPGAGTVARVPVIVDLGGSGLLRGVDGSTASVNVFVYAFDGDGQVRDFMQQRLSLEVDKVGSALRATGLRYVGALALPPGKYAIRTLARVEETGQTGVETAHLEVPEFGTSAVSAPVSVGEMGQWVTIVSQTRGREATGVLTLGERAFVPESHAEIAVGGEGEFALLVRGIRLEGAEIASEMVSGDGARHPAAVRLLGRTSPDEHGVVKLLFTLSAADLPRGDYELQMRVTPEGGTPAVRSIPVVLR